MQGKNESKFQIILFENHLPITELFKYFQSMVNPNVKAREHISCL